MKRNRNKRKRKSSNSLLNFKFYWKLETN